MVFIFGILGAEVFRWELHVPPPYHVDPRVAAYDEAIGADGWEDE